MIMETSMKVAVAATDAVEAQRLVDGLEAQGDGIEASWSSEPGRILELCVGGAHVAIVDSRMDALARTLRTRHPDLALVLTGPVIDDRCVALAVELHATAVSVWPCDAVAVARLLNAPAPSQVCPGTSRGVPTVSLLLMHCRSGADGVLSLRHPLDGRQGCVHVQGGQAVHASCGDLVGPVALQEMLGWPDASSDWVPGRTESRRTIVGRIEAVLERPVGSPDATPDSMVPIAYQGVVEKLSRLSQTPDILGAFLLRDAQVLTGRCAAHLDEPSISRALCRLANVYHDVDAQNGEDAGSEIQAMVGTLRLVIDRIGDAEDGFQVGVVVRQASPVCKSLRRLLRQIDRSYRRERVRASNQPGKGLAVA